MSAATEQGSLRELFTRLTSEMVDLFRKEIQLVRAETSERIGQAVGAVVALLAGAVLGIAALILLLETAAQALAVYTGLSLVLSGLIVGVIVAIVAVILIARAVSRLKATSLMPDRSARALGRDATMIKEHV